MTRRRRLVVSMGGVLALAGVAALPGVRWPVVGWVRGEPFYDGRPASYWAAEVEDSEWLGFAPSKSGRYNIPVRRARAVKSVLEQWYINVRWPGDSVIGESLMPHEDAAELPVLLVLLSHPSPRVRGFAALMAGELGAAGQPTVPRLRALASDQTEAFKDLTVAEAAEVALEVLAPLPVGDDAAGP
jgi:hypothetical protein